MFCCSRILNIYFRVKTHAPGTDPMHFCNMTDQLQNQGCRNCGKQVKGRSDKKFCNDYCRNYHNNQSKAEVNNYVRNINNALRKNRRILQELLPPNEDMSRMTKEQLLQAGFQFRYTTHSYRNKKGSTYFFCYDYGYLPLEHDWILVVKYMDG